MKEYYGKILQGNKDLQTNACCRTDENFTPAVKVALAEINGEIIANFMAAAPHCRLYLMVALFLILVVAQAVMLTLLPA